jgi:4-amino-4-deoxy-L-arabinose transferase-like glycosyltransferase
MSPSDSATTRHRSWPVTLIILTLFALALRWYYVSTAVVLDPVRGDATQYYSYAWNLIHHGVFTKDAPGAANVTPDNYRDPGYPLFLAFWMKALGTGSKWYAAVLLCQALLGALTVTLATQLGRHWLSGRWALGAGLLVAVWPHSITINGYLLTETLFSFLCVLGLLLFSRSCQRNTAWLAIAAGLVLGAAALTNAILLPFGVLLATFLAWRKFAPRRICLALAAGALLLPGAWAVRNAQISTLVSDNSSTARALQNLVQGSWPEYHSAWRDSVLGDAAAQAKAQATLQAIDAEYDVLLASPITGAKAILRRLGEHPLHYAGWYLLQKPRVLWGWNIRIGQGDVYVYPTQNSPFRINRFWIVLEVVAHALSPILMLLALTAPLVAWSQERRAKTSTDRDGQAILVAIIFLLVFVTLIYTALQAEPRYSIAFRPFEILLAMTTIAAAGSWWRNRNRLSSAVPKPSP